ncbi:dihydrolipoamide acetyltransferase family protein [Olivibacter domesticus]|uniref:Dihydrolipoamide acetyltransferase component of pyruvate dehydrogenase complex n=1 Tax=Olivibacter domesticus TaxID=407022 RepID=A0A1H7WXY5_OLID1|nr:dihydrolipoamide acetyltransferase family protein [Olivibacter domesticus]SEM26261.1 2-oxoglutarate dehydrogenase E2 component (dihydrolipoamide succinyltransferase) [Olivibacter domesticus]
MARYNLLLPSMGESVSEATIVNWLKHPGEVVNTDDTIVEIATDKVDSEVPSPVTGKLIEQRFHKDQVVQVGDVLAVLEVEGEGTEETNLGNSDVIEEPISETSAVEPAIPGLEQLAENDELSQESSAKIVSGDTGRFYSPLVKNIAQEEGISLDELENIQGSGLEGRVTKQDLIDYLAARGQSSEEAPLAKQETHASNTGKIESSAASVASGKDEIIEMDRMRRLIAEHMVHSAQTAPHVCSFVEADVTNVVNWRNKVKDVFQNRENEKLTFTPIFIEAVVKALKDFPMVNVSVNGTQIIKKHAINIGMATALPSGNLIVPVIKNAKELSLTGITKAVNDLANRARNNKLKPDDTQGGTFTLTNIGSFGNIMGTPIINQPQVAILAVGAITKKPAVIETEFGDMIGIRHMMFLSLSYDHRVVDGALGGMFVKRVADYLEQWDVNRTI